MSKKIELSERFGELMNCLNKLHQKGIKISYRGIADEMGITIQRAHQKFEPFAEHIKTLQNIERAEAAREAGAAKGYTLITLPDQVAGEHLPIEWQCSEGHIFTRTSNSMKLSNVLCPICKQNKKK